jgi:hypothetical protein
MLPYCEHLGSIRGVEVSLNFNNVAIVDRKVCQIVLVLADLPMPTGITFTRVDPLFVLKLRSLVGELYVIGF